MMKFLVAAVIAILVVAVPPSFAGDRLSASEIRKVVPGNWTGRYKKAPLVLAIAANGTITGRYAGIKTSGTWAVQGTAKGDKICLTFSVVVTRTKCGELFRNGSNKVYGYLNRGKPRLWLQRS